MLVDSIEAKVVSIILKERYANGVFKDFDDLIKRAEIPLEQLILLIRISALRTFTEKKKNLLWKAYQYHQKEPVKRQRLTLFEEKTVQYSLPLLEEDELESAFEEMELLGFPLRNPFDLIAKTTDAPIFSDCIQGYLGQRIETLGYLVAIKKSITNRGEAMFFGTFIDVNGKTLDTVHFPESGRKYPFRGKGIYRLKGIVTEEFGFYTLEVGEMDRISMVQDVRYKD
jgi:DNA polymerase-3 subunit alpha